MKRRTAFTLVELLVVIGIIAVLVGILLPSLQRARESANSIKCAANLRSIGQSLHMYVNQNKGLMPLIHQRNYPQPSQAGFVGGGRGWTVLGLLEEQTRVEIIQLRCPSDIRENDFFSINSRALWQPTNAEALNTPVYLDLYAFSYAALVIGYALPERRLFWSVPMADPLIVNKGPVSMAKIRRSSERHLVWDAYTNEYTIGVGIVGMGPPEAMTNADIRKVTFFRHGRGPNALFVDGHVEQKIDYKSMVTVNPTDDHFSMPK